MTDEKHSIPGPCRHGRGFPGHVAHSSGTRMSRKGVADVGGDGTGSPERGHWPLFTGSWQRVQSLVPDCPLPSLDPTTQGTGNWWPQGQTCIWVKGSVPRGPSGVTCLLVFLGHIPGSMAFLCQIFQENRVIKLASNKKSLFSCRSRREKASCERSASFV